MAKRAGGCQPAPWSLCARHTARPTYGHPMESTESESKDRLFVTALARGLAVLAAFRGGEPQLSNQDLASRTGLPKSTVSRLTYTLTQLGYLDQDPASGRYQLGLAVLELSAATLASFALATLSSLNHNIVGQSKNRYEVTIKVDQKVYVLRLTSVGSSNNLAVFNADNSFADQEIAAELLTQIYQNWPA